MEPNSPGFAAARQGVKGLAGRSAGIPVIRRTGAMQFLEGEGTMQQEARRMNGVEAHPVSELLSCPPETSILLTASAQTINFEAGEVIFRQSGHCEGLYLVIAGQLTRRSERMETRIVLGPARPGDLVELAAALGDGRHTYSLVAQTAGSLLLLPLAALQQAFAAHPALRMRLLEELAREVSRAYLTCTLSCRVRTRRRSGSSAA